MPLEETVCVPSPPHRSSSTWGKKYYSLAASCIRFISEKGSLCTVLIGNEVSGDGYGARSKQMCSWCDHCKTYESQ
ncbi:hypothetical protein ACP70R_000232 [Stipagrostis hirtigluma subsp. patula]